MGNSPSCSHNPIYVAPCTDNDRIGQLFDIPGYCLEKVVPNDCSNLGFGWGNGTAVKIDSKRSGLRCERLAFPSNKTSCCNNNTKVCFSDDQMRLSCAPATRSFNSPDCEVLFNQTCIALNSETAFLNAWQNPDSYCRNTVKWATFRPDGQINLADLDWIRKQIRQLMENYFSIQPLQGIIIPNTFRAELYKICKDNAPACSWGLYQECSQFDRLQANNSTAIANFCGCYLNADVYSEYQILFNISDICDPLCARSDSIPRSYKDGSLAICQSNFCIIDNITITIKDSQGDNINFSQICGGCSANTKCDCRITDFENIVQNGSNIGNIDINQECNGSLLCIKPDPANPNGAAIEVPCTNRSDTGIPTPEQVEQERLAQQQVLKRKIILWIIIASISFILLVIILIFIFGNKLEKDVIADQELKNLQEIEKSLKEKEKGAEEQYETFIPF